MTDREMLTLLYGALKAMKATNPELVRMLHDHLFGDKPERPPALPISGRGQ